MAKVSDEDQASVDRVEARARVLAGNLVGVRGRDARAADELASAYLTAAIAYLNTTKGGRKTYELLASLADDALNLELVR